MHIKQIISQTRRDLFVLYECEHCGHTERGTGYDDDYFHNEVIPARECRECGKAASKDCQQRIAKYGATDTV